VIRQRFLPNSIRWRLQLWFACLLVCVLSGFGITVYQLQRINQFKQIDDQLQRRITVLGDAVRSFRRPPGGGPPPDSGPGEGPFRGGPDRPPPGRADSPSPGPPPEKGDGPRSPRRFTEFAGLFDESRSNAFYYVMWHRDQAVLKHSTNAPAEVPLPDRIAFDTETHLRLRGIYREAYHFTGLGDCVLTGRSIAPTLNGLRRFALMLLAAGGGVLALGLGGAWWFTSRAIRPLEEISAAASRISAGNLSERVKTANPGDEIGRLAAVLNSTFARLEGAFARQTRFTADASHELRTPLAVIISEAQTTLSRERTAPEYRDAVEACLDTAQQMRRLTESLLELARLDAGQEQLQRAPLDLVQTAGDCVERILPLARQRGITIHCALAPAPANGNAEQLGQVITNLLANAIQYNQPNGEVRVQTLARNGQAVLIVADTGQGIAAEDLPHVFERFYRADKSRARANGHSGLGLSICKAILDAHAGSIAVSSQPWSGSTFTVTLPSPLATPPKAL
jgi:signal transduction histidine kinase